MHPELLSLLRCPECRAPVALSDRWRMEGDRVLEGGLTCGCGQRYAVIDGIPRLLPATLASLVQEKHPDFFARHPEYASTATSLCTAARRTAESFGFLWETHPEVRARFGDHWRSINSRFPDGFFRGRLLLEAGCGNGRYAVHYARAGARVVALDLSSAIDVARRNGGGEGELHFVQGDLTLPPLADDAFDFVNCFGVLQHLPRPEQGFASLLRLVRPGGYLQGYVYKSFEDENRAKYAALRGFATVRLLTTRLPRAWLSRALWAAIPTYLALVGAPHALLRRLGLERAARAWPLFQQIPVLDPRHAHELLVDRLTTPIEHRYTRDELAGWFEGAGLEEIQVHAFGGWIASGRKPAPPPRERAPVAGAASPASRPRLAVLS